MRSPDKLSACEAQGFTPLLFSGADGVRQALESATHCLVSVPPREADDPVLAAYGPALHTAGLAHVKIIVHDHNRDELLQRAAVRRGSRTATLHVALTLWPHVTDLVTSRGLT